MSNTEYQNTTTNQHEENPVQTEQLFGCYIFPPFIDAYQSDKEVQFSEIERKMKSYALEWGLEVVGESILTGKIIPSHNDKIVLCCAYTYIGNKEHKEFLLLVDDCCQNWYDNLQIVEGCILREWDIT